MWTLPPSTTATRKSGSVTPVTTPSRGASPTFVEETCTRSPTTAIANGGTPRGISPARSTRSLPGSSWRVAPWRLASAHRPRSRVNWCPPRYSADRSRGSSPGPARRAGLVRTRHRAGADPMSLLRRAPLQPVCSFHSTHPISTAGPPRGHRSPPGRGPVLAVPGNRPRRSGRSRSPLRGASAPSRPRVLSLLATDGWRRTACNTVSQNATRRLVLGT